MHQTPQAPNWAIVIEQIVATDLPMDELCAHTFMSLRMLKYLRYQGVQPLHWRGEVVLRVWCERTGRHREDVPLIPVHRGHRKSREAADRSPRVQSLPQWPPAVQRVDMQGRKRRKEPA